MISYCTRERALALRLRDRLAESSAPRLDCLDIELGERFKEQLAWWLSYCHMAVVLLSEDALASPWVRYELTVLVNRERTPGDPLTLVVLPIGTRVVERIADDDDLAPLGLGDLQGAVVAADADDDGIDAVIARVAAAAGSHPAGDPAFERLVKSVKRAITGVDSETLAEARRRIALTCGTEIDPWFDDPRIADDADGASRLRRALAAELLALPVELLYAPLEHLLKDRAMAIKPLAAIAELNVTTFFDAASIATLDQAAAAPPRAGQGRPGVVLGCTRDALGLLAPAAVEAVHDRPGPRVFWLDCQLTGSSDEDYPDMIEVMLEIEIEERYGVDATRVASWSKYGHPLFVLLAGCDGLSPKMLDEIRRRLPAFVVVVVATDRMGPAEWSALLHGLPVAGPAMPVAGWQQMLCDEAQLVDDWSALRSRLVVLDEELAA